jgi:superkiller protein 8
MPIINVTYNYSAMDGRVKVWDFEQKSCVATQTESNTTVWSAKWQRASDGFITGGADKSLYWYIAAGV